MFLTPPVKKLRHYREYDLVNIVKSDIKFKKLHDLIEDSEGFMPVLRKVIVYECRRVSKLTVKVEPVIVEKIVCPFCILIPIHFCIQDENPIGMESDEHEEDEKSHEFDRENTEPVCKKRRLLPVEPNSDENG